MKTYPKILSALLVAAFLFSGDVPTQKVMLLYPAMPQDSVSYDQGKIFLLSVIKDSTASLLASQQWEQTQYIELTTPVLRDAFPKSLFLMFPPHSTIQELRYVLKADNKFAVPESVVYKYTDTMNLRTLWSQQFVVDLLKKVQDKNGTQILVTARGWTDTVYTTQFDDPNADSRALYKLQLHLLPGLNSIYFAYKGLKTEAVEYTTNLVNESHSLESRENRFHNSVLEQSCITCHEGLPSADSGKSNKAECNTCHKALASATMVHAPVEMKECGSCHEWSADKKSMTVVSGTPDKCYECHSEKKAWIDSAKVPHPVATECLDCHSPHGSGEAHLLKKDVYTLCTGCHTEQMMNHPVGRHPLRFAKTRDGGTISCVSCHNPHGSPNDKLLNAAGGSMAICVKCHN